MTNLVEINNLNKSLFLDPRVKKTVLKDICITIPLSEKGNITSIIAPLGAGKTTLLKIISGIEKYESGTMGFSNNNPSVKPLITETISVLPWLTVKKNIMFFIKSIKDKISDEKLKNIIDDVGLTNYEDFYPQNENTGFQFRIALARSLAFNPKIILIDDSFKNLDLDTRNEIYATLIKVVDKYCLEIILATTNLIEAVYLSDQIFLMSKNPATIIFELKNQNKYDDIQTMVNSDSFRLISQQVQSKFQDNSGIAVIHYSV